MDISNFEYNASQSNLSEPKGKKSSRVFDAEVQGFSYNGDEGLVVVASLHPGVQLWEKLPTAVQFIQHFTSEGVPGGGGSLNSQTPHIKTYPVTLGDESVVLVDIPVIDYPGYTYLEIVKWMAEVTLEPKYGTQTTSKAHLVNNRGLFEQQGATIRQSEDTTECTREIVEAILTVHHRFLCTTPQPTILQVEPLDVKTISARNCLVIVGSSGRKSSINNENVLLLDTSGIASPSDLERVSGLLLQWLKEQAKLICMWNVYLDGIIFIHPINPLPGQGMVQQMHLIKQFNKLPGNLKDIRDRKT
ncbi:hypothetical protein P691DRAFT_854558 [Macrolepiota fuliginosa MF-IS2]|uniref:Uncharacterized protein n=1 Tax=Macrolepiota fuliginosa MF-IS2 TaxID=1400762 RepID=A0A9P6BXD8_9AGAR|nr:hypothetical protein P691DRAFT_854558 [Macrolepiota fuliginosa MF-IS2]